MQKALNPPDEAHVERFGWSFCPGDKVMQVENDYDHEVYNGDLGIVQRIDLEESELVVTFDGRAVSYGFGELDELVLAYATTIHKSQGSEYPAVVIPLVTQHYMMLARNLLYTGVTRGKRLVVLVGQRKALAIAVRNRGSRRRWAKHLYRALDRAGRTVDFRLSARRDVAAAKAFFRKAVRGQQRAPQTITLDGCAASHRAVRELKADGSLPSDTKLRLSKYLNNLIEQDHRGVKQRIAVMLGFKSFRHAAITIAGIELMHRIRKGQFGLGHLDVQGRTASAVWNALLGA